MKKLLFIIATFVLFLFHPLQHIRQYYILLSFVYSSVIEQTVRTLEDKRVRAILASKIDAYRELAEQVYGMRVSGRAELADQRLGIESTSGAVDGVIRGAEVVRSYLVEDSYVTELRLDIRKMDKLRDYGEVQQVPEKRQQTLF